MPPRQRRKRKNEQTDADGLPLLRGRGGGVLPSCGDNAAAACCRCRRQQQAKGSIGVAR
jgi:hypothetical protein